METKKVKLTLSVIVLITINGIVAVLLTWWLLGCLGAAELKYRTLGEISRQHDIHQKAQDLLILHNDSIPKPALDSLITEVRGSVSRMATLSATRANAESVSFYDILLMMLLAGSLGGVLCNLRGFFIHYRSEDQTFPENLIIPYYTRPVLGGGGGLFIYFVASFLITSVTTEQTANNITFQGMVTFIALAMLAGFGSLEFFQRLKETCMALFGQKAEKDKWEKLDVLFTNWKKGVIDKDEYDEMKLKILESNVDPEFSRALKMRAAATRGQLVNPSTAVGDAEPSGTE